MFYTEAGGLFDFQPSFRGGSLSFVKNGRGESCVFKPPHLQMLRPTFPGVLFDHSLSPLRVTRKDVPPERKYGHSKATELVHVAAINFPLTINRCFLLIPSCAIVRQTWPRENAKNGCFLRIFS